MSEQQDRLSNRDVITLKHDITLSDSDEEELTSVPFDPEVKTLSSSDDEDECGGDDGGGGGAAGRLMSSASGQSATFSLKGGSTSFSSRSRSIFDSLDTAAKVASSALGQDNVIDGVFARPPPPPPLASNGKRPRGGESKTDRPPLRDSSGPVSSFRTGGGEPHGRESSGPVSSFRTGGGEPHGRGSGRPRRGGGVPDYLLHPERWTCYSLEDVPDSSDADNRATAHQYLSSLQRRKERMEEEEEEEEDEAFIPAYNQGSDQSDCRSSQHKILFSRPGRGRQQQKVSAGREKEKPLCHLDEDEGKEGGTEKAGERARNVGDEEEEEEEEEGRPTIRPPGAQDRQRKRKQQAGREEMEEDEEEHEKNPGGFVAFRKSSNRKNYRRTSEQDD